MASTDEQKKILREAMLPKEMGTVIASRTMKRLRPDGSVEMVTIEIGTPREIPVPYGSNPTTWACTARISLIPRILGKTGMSSLDAIISATYLVSTVLSALPFAQEIDMSLLPFFGLPISPITTTPEQLAAEQNRPKAITFPSQITMPHTNEAGS